MHLVHFQLISTEKLILFDLQWLRVLRTGSAKSTLNRYLLKLLKIDVELIVMRLIFKLAARGLNLVLISRSPAKLQTTKTEIGKCNSLFKNSESSPQV